MTQKETSELVVEEMDVVNTADVSDDSANAEDAPAVVLNEENEIVDDLLPAVDYLNPTLFGSLAVGCLNPDGLRFRGFLVPAL